MFLIMVVFLDNLPIRMYRADDIETPKGGYLEANQECVPNLPVGGCSLDDPAKRF